VTAIRFRRPRSLNGWAFNNQLMLSAPRCRDRWRALLSADSRNDGPLTLFGQERAIYGRGREGEEDKAMSTRGIAAITVALAIGVACIWLLSMMARE
jgi:hypothetical protein